MGGETRVCICADCGGAMRIPAATASDIDDICCKTRLVIRGKKEG